MRLYGSWLLAGLRSRILSAVVLLQIRSGDITNSGDEVLWLPSSLFPLLSAYLLAAFSASAWRIRLCDFPNTKDQAACNKVDVTEDSVKVESVVVCSPCGADARLIHSLNGSTWWEYSKYFEHECSGRVSEVQEFDPSTPEHVATAYTHKNSETLAHFDARLVDVQQNGLRRSLRTCFDQRIHIFTQDVVWTTPSSLLSWMGLVARSLRQ